jgi:hypothetical protein
MFYKLLGMLTWNGAKWFLRRKYGSTMVPKSLIAGVLVAVLAGIALLVTARQRGDS